MDKTIISSQFRATIPQLPLFAGLQGVALEFLRSRLHFQKLAPEQVFVTEDAEADDVYFLVAGEVMVTVGGRVVNLLRAPKTLGLLAAMEGQRRSASLKSMSEVELYRLSRADFGELRRISPAFNENLIAYLLGELRDLYRTVGESQKHFDDFFISPNAKLVPGPYVGDPFEMYIFVMRDQPEKLERLLPKGLRPAPGFGGKYLLTFNFFTRVYSKNPAGGEATFAYRETAPFIPCLGPGLRPAAFCPELYPDNFLAITLGRELYGFPKRFGQTRKTDNQIDLLLANRLILRASWEAVAALDTRSLTARLGEVLLGSKGGWMSGAIASPISAAIDFMGRQTNPSMWPSVPVLVHKQIPDASSALQEVLAIDQLVEIPFEVSSLSSVSELTGAALKYLSDDYFLGGECLGAFVLQMGFSFGKGRMLSDYLA